MYVPGYLSNMMATESSKNFIGGFKPEVDSTTSTSIYVTWQVEDIVGPFINAFQVHYQKVASSYIQYSNLLEASDNGYNIENLVADTYYKVCVVMYRNDTSDEIRQCMDANTNSWHIPVSIGSSIGAVLALSIIVFIVLLSRCPSLIHSQRRQVTSDSSKYDSMSSHYPDDHHEFSESTVHCTGHDHSSDTLSEHQLHRDDGGTLAGGGSMSPLTEQVKHGAGGRMCNGNRNIVLQQHTHRTRVLNERMSAHVHRSRPYHHSLILERTQPAMLLHTNSLDERQRPVLFHTTSLDEPIHPKDFPV
ncbi:uncharacterized protein LOC121381127 [Gigantopelta aegis]|uniref:uncharacterized protein LOC121381127 n=1 Tax=Gigantopelta aegis TaxID=1735272 RepID=UPI001B88781C|nr:uncharacterized protein LOC121381127 [Gigantopelta aegis]XP_041366195.1 uncharacterized protein LOC121381127 [Gigantopelta aegis]